MHMAAQGGQLEMLKFLSPMFEARVREKDSYEWTSLHRAAHFGHCQVARFLTEELKIDPRDRDKVCGVLERRSCVQSAASVYILIVANTSNVHVLCWMMSHRDKLNLEIVYQSNVYKASRTPGCSKYTYYLWRNMHLNSISNMLRIPLCCSCRSQSMYYTLVHSSHRSH